MKIDRRTFLKQSLVGALGLALAPAALVPAPAKVPAALGTNPLFTGALGQYEGVCIYGAEIVEPVASDLFTYGSAAVKHTCIEHELKGEWIPFNKLTRQGCR